MSERSARLVNAHQHYLDTIRGFAQQVYELIPHMRPDHRGKAEKLLAAMRGEQTYAAGRVRSGMGSIPYWEPSPTDNPPPRETVNP